MPKVASFDWFGATESTCMHCGETGHKGIECPANPAGGYYLSVKAPKAKKAKAKKAASDNLSDTTLAESEASKQTEEREYKLGYLGKDGKGRKLKNSKVGVPDRLHHDGATADVYVGDIDCSEKMLDKLEITSIVDARALGAEKIHYKNKEVFRYPISDFANMSGEFDAATCEGAKRCLNPLLEFLEDRTAKGQNVLIQCQNGSQQAGACAIAWYMYEEAMSLEDALAEAQNLRRKIYLKNKRVESLLEVFGEALAKDPEMAFRKHYDAQADRREMLKRL